MCFNISDRENENLKIQNTYVISRSDYLPFYGNLIICTLTEWNLDCFGTSIWFAVYTSSFTPTAQVRLYSCVKGIYGLFAQPQRHTIFPPPVHDSFAA